MNKHEPDMYGINDKLIGYKVEKLRNVISATPALILAQTMPTKM